MRGNQTFAVAANKWRLAKEQTAAPSSLIRWDIALHVHLLPAFGAMSLRSITPDLLDCYYATKRVPTFEARDRRMAVRTSAYADPRLGERGNRRATHAEPSTRKESGRKVEKPLSRRPACVRTGYGCSARVVCKIATGKAR